MKFANFFLILFCVENEEEEFFPSMKTLSSFTLRQRRGIQSTKDFLDLAQLEIERDVVIIISTASQIMLPSVSSLAQMLVHSSLIRNFISCLELFVEHTFQLEANLEHTQRNSMMGYIERPRNLSRFEINELKKTFVTQYFNESRPFACSLNRREKGHGIFMNSTSEF